ncbi:hypothetical protein FHX34_103582 [Actinoplanes teichomyceticus]|uniref:Uncharacterized protein n=1 Tax=Actinoplanes teichomyceticus TaxID=1867 RepID=A0A561WB23_ACTTI|nr:hypothetical protein FHX34_103582 [Actinoplanes teichomyceticus]GIF14873.1 hypothetical protein Ate01nite_49050 [Actinoplanes teichomyceticus]
MTAGHTVTGFDHDPARIARARPVRPEPAERIGPACRRGQYPMRKVASCLAVVAEPLVTGSMRST